MEQPTVISVDVLGAYAADAAREVDGVAGLVDSPLHRQRGARVTDQDGTVGVELQLVLDWGASAPEVGAAVQERVSSYLERMAGVTPSAVDVVVAEIGPPPG